MELPLLRARSKFSFETIEYQDDDFAAKLELIISEIQSKIINGAYEKDIQIVESREVRDLTNIFMERFGMKIKITVDGPLAAILPFYSNKHHVLLDSMWRGHISIKEQDKVLRNAQGKKGTINTAKATVGGFFSECECDLYMNFRALFKTYKMSAPEVTAVTLHELGHAFYGFEYSDRMETANQVMQNVIKEVTSKKDKSDRVYVYKELKSVNSKITEQEVDSLLTGNRVIAGKTWFKVIIGTVEEQLQDSTYAKNSFEQLADNFATRFGYGRSLVSGLEKLVGHYYLNPEKSKAGFSLLYFFESLSFVVMAATAVIAMPLTPLLAIICGALAFLSLRAGAEDARDYTYDDLKIRYKRVRNEYVERLKDMKLSSEIVKPILDDINFMDKIISETYVYRNAIEYFSNFIFSSASKAKKSIQEQQLLEELAMNDLFIASAEIRTLNN